MGLHITIQSHKGAQGLSPRVGSGNDSLCSAPHRFAERLVVPLRYTARPCIPGDGAPPTSIFAGQGWSRQSLLLAHAAWLALDRLDAAQLEALLLIGVTTAEPLDEILLVGRHPGLRPTGENLALCVFVEYNELAISN